LIKGRRRLETEEVDVDARLTECREQQRAIKLKSSPESLSAKDLRRLENLEDEERYVVNLFLRWGLPMGTSESSHTALYFCFPMT
jgi:hypothetical protein